MTGDNSGLESLSILVTKLSVSTIVRNGHTFDLRRLTWLFQKFCCKDLDGIAQMQLRNWTNWYHKRSGSVTLPYGFLQQTANKKRWSAKTHMKPLNFWCTSLFFQNKHPFPTFQNLQTCPLRSHSLPHLHGHRCAEAFRRAVKDDGACTTCRKGRQGGHVDIYESKIGELRKADMKREQNLRCSKHRVGYESKVLSRTYGKEIIKQSLLFLNFIIFHLFILCSPCLKFQTHPACLQQLPGQKASNFEKLMTCLVSTIHSIKFHQNKNPIEIPLFLHPLCCFFVSFSLCALLTLQMIGLLPRWLLWVVLQCGSSRNLRSRCFLKHGNVGMFLILLISLRFHMVFATMAQIPPISQNMFSFHKTSSILETFAHKSWKTPRNS